MEILIISVSIANLIMWFSIRKYFLNQGFKRGVEITHERIGNDLYNCAYWFSKYPYTVKALEYYGKIIKEGRIPTPEEVRSNTEF